MVDFKLVMGTKDGKSFQKEIKSPEADALHKKRIGEKISGDELGSPGYQFEITGGSDKCGFPMRKGIQQPRKRVIIGKSVGFSGRKRFLNKKKNLRKQKGLFRRRTVCGERITGIINQVNLKVLKEGPAALGEEKPAEKPAEGKEPAEEKAVEKKEKKSAVPPPGRPSPAEAKEEPKVEEEAEGKPEAELSDKEKDQPKKTPEEEKPAR